MLTKPTPLDSAPASWTPHKTARVRSGTRLARSGTVLGFVILASTACAPLLPGADGGQQREPSDEMVAQVANGMTRERVRELLGPPARVGSDPLTRQEEWLWRYLRLAIYETCFYVRFDTDGRVSGTATALENLRGSPDSFKPC